MKVETRGPSVLKMVGCGCAALLAAGLLAVGGLTYYGYREVRDLQAQFDDPQRAAAEVHEVLGTSELPAGYHPEGGLHVPFLVDVAFLSDRQSPPPGEGEGRPRPPQRAGFLYLSMAFFGPDPAAVRGRLRDDLGPTDDPPPGGGEPLVPPPGDELPIGPASGEIVGRGEVPIPGGRARYVATRQGADETGPGEEPGFVTHLEIDCGDDRRTRYAEWFAAVPATAQGEDPDPAGTPADPAALEAFLEHFRLCR